MKLLVQLSVPVAQISGKKKVVLPEQVAARIYRISSTCHG
jgi:hypothetical protein